MNNKRQVRPNDKAGNFLANMNRQFSGYFNPERSKLLFRNKKQKTYVEQLRQESE